MESGAHPSGCALTLRGTPTAWLRDAPLELPQQGFDSHPAGYAFAAVLWRKMASGSQGRYNREGRACLRGGAFYG